MEPTRLSPPAPRQPLAQRLERLRNNLPAPAYSEAVVRRWASTRLEDYLAGQPLAKERLDGLLAPQGLKQTYQQAALRCVELLEDPETRSTGEDILWYLSFPLQALAQRRL